MKDSDFFEKRKEADVLSKEVEKQAVKENKLNVGDYEKIKVKTTAEANSSDDYDLQSIELMASMDSKNGGQIYEIEKTKKQINKINQEIRKFKREPLGDKDEEINRFINLMEKEVKKERKLDNLLEGN
ncbi:MAG: hypothetical protein PHT84_00830 [Candidatus Pacebacteria bacterium]|jgi:hypothetical protein|nr:hypothetical protein [Candidatus Paceibacterota bacterium]